MSGAILVGSVLLLSTHTARTPDIPDNLEQTGVLLILFLSCSRTKV